MNNALDIAYWFLFYNDYMRNILNQDTDYISNLRLQKLLYYAQGSYLALKGKPLFKDDIVALDQGPVIKNVYDEFKDFKGNGIKREFRFVNIDPETKDILINVYKVFGEYSAWGLRKLILSEKPYMETKLGDIISLDLMENYFKKNYI